MPAASGVPLGTWFRRRTPPRNSPACGHRLQMRELFFYGDAEATDAFADLVGCGRREIQAHVPPALIAVSVGGVEAVARNKGDVLAHGGFEELVGVGAFGAASPTGRGHPLAWSR